MMELVLAILILLMMVGFMMLDHRQYESRLKQSYDEGFRDGVTAMGSTHKFTVAERLAELEMKKD